MRVGASAPLTLGTIAVRAEPSTISKAPPMESQLRRSENS